MYHCYLIELKQNFDSDVPVHDIVLVMRSELDSDLGSMHFDLDVDRGSLTVNFKYVGVTHLSPEQVTSLFFFLSLLCSFNWCIK
jgi:endoribonuclease Dicer